MRRERPVIRQPRPLQLRAGQPHISARPPLRCVQSVVQGHPGSRHPEGLQLRKKRRIFTGMTGADQGESVVSAEIYVREGRRAERVSPMTYVVLALNVDRPQADGV